MNNLTCGKCGGFIISEKDRYGCLLICLNCGLEAYTTINSNVIPYQAEHVYQLAVPDDLKLNINRSGYSSWLPTGVQW